MAELNSLSLKNDANLQVYYRFEDNLTDSSTNGRTGTFEATTGSATYTAGRYGKGLDLEQDNNQRVRSYNPALGTSTFFVSLWIMLESMLSTDQYGFASTYKAGTPRGFYIGRNTLYGGINLVCQRDGANVDTLTGQIPLEAGKKIHIVAGRDANYLRLFVNGREDPASLALVTNNNRDLSSGVELVFGALYSDTPGGDFGEMDGVLDDAALFTRGPTLADAQKLFLDGGGMLLGLV